MEFDPMHAPIQQHNYRVGQVVHALWQWADRPSTRAASPATIVALPGNGKVALTWAEPGYPLFVTHVSQIRALPDVSKPRALGADRIAKLEREIGEVNRRLSILEEIELRRSRIGQGGIFWKN
jgi:hypothetical protein